MTRETYNPKTVFDSRKYGFSQAVGTRGGHHLFLSGQVGIDVDERCAGIDLASQLERAIANVREVIRAAGGSLADVVVLRIYLLASERDNQKVVADALLRWFPDQPPATSWILVAGLSDPNWLVELEAEAVLEGADAD